MMAKQWRRMRLVLLLLLGLVVLFSLRASILSLYKYLPETTKEKTSSTKHFGDTFFLSENDKPNIGKSCHYRPPETSRYQQWYWIFLVRYSYLFPFIEYWDCQECFADNDENENNHHVTVTAASAATTSYSCKKLSRRHYCRAFPSESWDHPFPRVMSMQNEFDATTIPFQTLHKHVYGPTKTDSYTNHPHCSVQECFNLTQCVGKNRTNPLAVYAHGKEFKEHLQNVFFTGMNEPRIIRLVDNPDDACLRLVHPMSPYTTSDEMWMSPAWQNGQNHYVLYAHVIFQGHGDFPFPYPQTHFGSAALSSPNLDKAYHRSGYDTVHGMRKWNRPEQYQNLELHRPRRYVLSFKGKLMGRGINMYYQHRWLAIEYWEIADDILVDVKCRGHDQYKYSQPQDYGDILLNSTFVFCPGGGSVMSFRFGEALIADAIPVVTATFIPPFYPDIVDEWNDCLVRVSDAKIIDLPRRLRNMSSKEIRSRQKICRKLADNLFSDDLNRKHLIMAMKIWNKRISNALKNEEIQLLE